MENGTKEFHAILVRGGETGKKLHVASNGTSSLGCGHWTKRHLLKMRDYRIEDNKLIYRKSQGSECGRRNMWDVSTFNTFSKMVEESPEGCCVGCTKRLDEIKQSLNLT